MRNMNKIIAVTTAFVLSSTAAFAVITGSKHDLSSTNPTAGITVKDSAQTQICIFCHTPHNASSSNLLWNRTETNITATYNMYSSSTMSTIVGAAAALDNGSTSYLCLTCHDGTIADMNTNTKNFGSLTPALADTGTVGSTDWPSLYQIGRSPNFSTPVAQGDLRDDHPINFNYAAAQALNASGLKDTTTVTTNLTALATGKAPFDASGKMQCGSCHLVHNEATGATPPSYLLRVSESGSALCLSCHTK